MSAWFFFSIRIKDLNLDPRLNRIVNVICPEEDTTIRVLGNLKFKVEYKISISLFSPDILSAVLCESNNLHS